MRNFAEHLDRIREQPHHVRHQIALSTAGAFAGLVGVVWLGASLATGAFALEGTSFAEATGAQVETSSPNDAASGSENVAGAAAALETPEEKQAPASTRDEPAHVNIVPSTDPEPKKQVPKSNSTIIPF